MLSKGPHRRRVGSAEAVAVEEQQLDDLALGGFHGPGLNGRDQLLRLAGAHFLRDEQRRRSWAFAADSVCTAISGSFGCSGRWLMYGLLAHAPSRNHAGLAGRRRLVLQL
jgi:hypothetical protein